jgi:hypothetical protein
LLRIGLVPDTTKVPVNENTRKLAKETNISDPYFLKLHNPYVDLTIISVPFTGEVSTQKMNKELAYSANSLVLSSTFWRIIRIASD